MICRAPVIFMIRLDKTCFFYFEVLLPLWGFKLICLPFPLIHFLHTISTLWLSVSIWARECLDISLHLWIRWRLRLGEFTDSKGSMKEGDSEPIICGLMVPRVQGWATTKRLQETSIPDQPAPLSLHSQSVGINSQLSGEEWSMPFTSCSYGHTCTSSWKE